MRIIYIHQYFNTPDMNGSTRSYEMSKRLAAKGHRVHMITARRRPSSSREIRVQEEVVDGIDVTWLPVRYANNMNYLQRLISFFKFAALTGPRAADKSADLVYAASPPLTVALPAVYAAKKYKIPLVFEVMDLWPEVAFALGALRDPISKAGALWLERFAYRHSDHIVALSPAMKTGVQSKGYPGEKITVIPNSCDFDFFDVGPEAGTELRERYDWLRDRPLIMYAGALGLANSVSYMARLAAAAMKIDPEVRFLVIGEGGEKDKVEKTAVELGVLNKNFFMLPGVPKTEMPKWLSAADISASLLINVPPVWANSANKVFDSYAAGKPIAVNYGGWKAEMIEKEGVGIFLDPERVEQAAAALVRVIRDKNWLQQAGRAGYELGKKKFDRDKLAAQLEQVMLEVVEKSKRQASASPVEQLGHPRP